MPQLAEHPVETRRLQLARELLKEIDHVSPGTAYERALDDQPDPNERQLRFALKNYLAQK